MTIKGILIPIGGNEDKGVKSTVLHVKDTDHDFFTSGILYRVAAEMKNQDAPIEIVTTASSIPHRVGPLYIRAFKKLGYKNVGLIEVISNEEADNEQILRRIENAGCILFSGGDQFRLTSVFKDTAFVRLMHDRYIHDSIVIAGTSAGAMAMPDLMIYPGPHPKDGQNPRVFTYPGFSLIHETIIDTHFLVRGRFRRLAIAVANNPTHLGIGLEEDTGIIIREGNKLETIGSGVVTIIDGRSLKDMNQTVVQEKHELFIENLLVHILQHGNNFTLKNKHIT